MSKKHTSGQCASNCSARAQAAAELPSTAEDRKAKTETFHEQIEPRPYHRC